jgi:hypothetical protein
MEAAAMGCVSPDGAGGACQPHIGAAFGAVAVQHVDGHTGGPPRHMRNRRHIPQADLPAHGHAADAERKRGRQIRQLSLCRGAAGRSIGDDADPVPARRLAARQIEHMPEQSADRSAQHMQNVDAS